MVSTEHSLRICKMLAYLRLINLVYSQSRDILYSLEHGYNGHSQTLVVKQKVIAVFYVYVDHQRPCQGINSEVHNY
jgi:uncharacterized protein YbbC (DUF1343 family)